MSMVFYLRFIVVIFFITTINSAQEKYLIYLKDKGPAETTVLNKTNPAYEKIASKFISQRSIKRRMKKMGDEYFNYKDLPVYQEYIKVISKSATKIIHQLKWFNAVSVNLTDDQLFVIRDLPFVKSIRQIKKIRKKYRKELIPVEEYNSNTLSKKNTLYNYGPSLTQNQLSNIPDLHDAGINGENIIIGLMDTGFNWKNRSVFSRLNVIAEYDFIFNDSSTANDSLDVAGQHSHGSNVLSIIAGFSPNNLIGPAFNSKFVLAKTEFVPTETHVEEDNFVAALEWMDSIGVDLTSSSLGYNIFDTGEGDYSVSDLDGKTALVTQAVELAFDRGILTITSAGNEGNDPWKYVTAPADGFNTIAVGAVNSDNVVTSFSSIGPTADGRIKPDIVAQGANVFRANSSSDGFGYGNGTSFSAPIAAGVAAQVLSANPHLTNIQLRDILLKSGDSYNSPNNSRGYGLISAKKAVEYPNLSFENNIYKIHKIFLDNSNIQSGSMNIKYFGSDNNVKSILMNSSDNSIFISEIDQYSNSEIVKFFFEYTDNSNNIVRFPAQENFAFSYGDLIVNFSGQLSFPSNYKIYPIYPNPFIGAINKSNFIKFDLPEDSKIKITLYDILGKKVKILMDEFRYAGSNQMFEFELKGISSGVYFYLFEANSFIDTGKMIYIK